MVPSSFDSSKESYPGLKVHCVVMGSFPCLWPLPLWSSLLWPLSCNMASLWNRKPSIPPLPFDDDTPSRSISPYISGRWLLVISGANLCRVLDMSEGVSTLGTPLRHFLGISELRTGRLAATQPKKRSITVQICPCEASPMRSCVKHGVWIW